MKQWKDIISRYWNTHSKAIISIVGVIIVFIVALVVGTTGNMRSDSDHRDHQSFEQTSEKSFQSRVMEKRQELVDPVKPYAPDSIVLSNTTKKRAKKLAKELGAKVRTTKKGDFATLYLPEGVTIEDVYANEKYAADILEMTPDYQVKTAEVDALGKELVAARPQYEVTDELY